MTRRIVLILLAAVVLSGLHARFAAASDTTGIPIAEFMQPPLPQVGPDSTAQPSDTPGGIPPGEKPIGALTTNIQPTAGQLPKDYAAPLFLQQGIDSPIPGAGRGWADNGFAWDAPALRHRPLYFEEVNLERHGYSFGCLQPVVSAAHFFGRIPALPYLKTADPSRKCVYSLGYRRPGTCTPHQCHRPPLSVKAAAAQGAAVTGLIYLIP